MANGVASPVLGYFIRMFPQLSETFIANEILRIERSGQPIRIYSYRRPIEKVDHECVRSIRTPVHYLPDPLWKSPLAILKAAGSSYGRESKRWRQTFRYVLRRSLRERTFHVWKRYFQAFCLAEQLTTDEVGHVHAHFAHTSTDVAMLASMLTGIRFSFTGHARDVYQSPPQLLKEKVGAAEFVVTCTDANRLYLEAIAGPGQKNKVVLVYHGVDAEKFRPAGGEKPLPQLILSVGRLVEKKGFPDLLRAMALLKAKGIAFRGLIIGEGPERPRLEAALNELDLVDRVALPGACAQEELVEIYQAATAFVLPCRVLDNGDRDGLPNVLLEAMAAGLPIVSSDISGIPELIQNGENGLLVDGRDPDQIASALELLLRDSELRRRLGGNGRRTVTESFSADVMARKLAALFDQALSNGVQQKPALAPFLRGESVE